MHRLLLLLVWEKEPQLKNVLVVVWQRFNVVFSRVFYAFSLICTYIGKMAISKAKRNPTGGFRFWSTWKHAYLLPSRNFSQSESSMQTGSGVGAGPVDWLAMFLFWAALPRPKIALNMITKRTAEAEAMEAVMWCWLFILCVFEFGGRLGTEGSSPRL